MPATELSISVVVTTDRNVDVLDVFIRSLREFSRETVWRTELVVVDDLAVVDDACWDRMTNDVGSEAFFHAKIMRPSRRIGQERAILAGTALVTGDVLLVMAPDMHANIPDIRKLVDEFRRGNEVVFACRVYRHNVPRLRIAVSRLYNRMAQIAARTTLPDINTPMFLVSKAALGAARAMPPLAASHKLYLVDAFRGRVSGISIRTGHETKKDSSYSPWMLLVTYLSRIRDLFMFSAFLRTRPGAALHRNDSA